MSRQRHRARKERLSQRGPRMLVRSPYSSLWNRFVQTRRRGLGSGRKGRQGGQRQELWMRHLEMQQPVAGLPREPWGPEDPLVPELGNRSASCPTSPPQRRGRTQSQVGLPKHAVRWCIPRMSTQPSQPPASVLPLTPSHSNL